MILVMFGVAFALLGVAAFAWGVDSRDGSTDPRRSPYPVGIS
jgi:hypothetical protein